MTEKQEGVVAQLRKHAMTLDDIEDWLKSIIEDEKSDEEWEELMEKHKFVKLDEIEKVVGARRQRLQNELVGRLPLLTNDEIHEYLYAEDDKGDIFSTGENQGVVKTIQKILEMLGGAEP